MSLFSSSFPGFLPVSPAPPPWKVGWSTRSPATSARARDPRSISGFLFSRGELLQNLKAQTRQPGAESEPLHPWMIGLCIVPGLYLRALACKLRVFHCLGVLTPRPSLTWRPAQRGHGDKVRRNHASDFLISTEDLRQISNWDPISCDPNNLLAYAARRLRALKNRSSWCVGVPRCRLIS